MLMEQLHPFDETDVRFLKVRGEKLIKAYVYPWMKWNKTPCV